MKRLVKYLALLITLASPAAALDLSAMSPEEKEAFGAAVRSYLLENPEVFIEVVTVLENRRADAESAQEQAMVAQNWQEIYNDGYSHITGNPQGDVNLVEFLDYRCAYCRRAHHEVRNMLQEDGNIRMVYKEYPILGDQSVLASRFAIATRRVFGGQAYEDMQDALMAFTGNITEPALRRLASSMDLDPEALVAEMYSEEVTHEISRNQVLGSALAISGTPTFVLESAMLRGYIQPDQFAALIREARAK